MTKRIIPFLIVLLFIFNSIQSQNVETFLTSNFSSGNLYVHTDGKIYSSDFLGTNGFNGSTVNIININGEVENTIRGLRLPTGIAFDAEENLYIANYGLGTITKIAPDETRSTFASGLNGPTGILFDDEGNLIVANGGFPTYANNYIAKISPDGNVTTIVASDLLVGADGFTKDEEGNFYVSNFADGKIHKVTPSGEISLFAELPNDGDASANWLAYSNGLFYCASQRRDIIYKIDLEGNVSEFAGSGQRGGDDGTILSATFDRPNGLAFSVTGDTLFVSESSVNRIRMITGMDQITDISENVSLPTDFQLNQNYPNPFNPSTVISYQLPAYSSVKLVIYNSLGEEVRTLINNNQNAGYYEIQFDGSDLTSGVYYYQLIADNFIQTKKMIFLK